MSAKLFIAALVLLAVFAAIEARGGQTSSFGRSSTKSVSGPKSRRPAPKSVKKQPRPKKVPRPKRHRKPFPYEEFLNKNAGHFTSATRACLFSCKTSKFSLFKCTRACFAQACLRRVPKLHVRCALKCTKFFGRGKCKKICDKVSTKLQLKCRRFK
jgi:hypothetical protein